MRRKASRGAESLRSSAFGFSKHIEVHETRGNPAAVAEAEIALNLTLDELEAVDGVRMPDVRFGRLTDLGPVPVRGDVVDRLRARMNAKARR
jgi:hypothetical protein